MSNKNERARNELLELIEKATNGNITVEEGSSLNQVLLGRKAQTLRMVAISRRRWDSNYNEVWDNTMVPENRLSRWFGLQKFEKFKEMEIILNDGGKLKVNTPAAYYYLGETPPILYVDFVSKSNGMNPDQDIAYEKCVKEIANGMKYKGSVYEYTQSSSAQQRALKGVFVKNDFQISEEYLALFDTSIRGCKKYLDYLRSLRGAEAILECMTYGSYSSEFKDKEYSPAKFGARVGTSQTSTKSLGNDFRVKHIGEVKVKFTDEVEQAMRAKLLPYLGIKTIDKVIATVKELWKEEKLDGQSLVRASSVIRGLGRLGVKAKLEDISGKLIQLRWAGVKGTALVIPDEYLDNCKLPDGSSPYAEYDLIVEHSSWKYTPNMKFYTGAVAPELELVQISKARHSNNLNYQFVQALDGDGNNEIKTKDLFKELIDRMYQKLRDAMQVPEVAKAILGMNSTDEIADKLDIDNYGMTLKSKASNALDADDKITEDPWWRLRILSVFAKTEEEASYGKILVEGANRYVISDPIGMLRTDLAVPRKKNNKAVLDHDGNPMFDIIIDKIDQMALRDVDTCSWNDTAKPAVLFRSPCVHPGEPQSVTLISNDGVPSVISTGYGSIDVHALFSMMKDICVVNVFSNILDALGGADTDGDTVLVCIDPIVVRLRSPRRISLVTKTDGKTATMPICVDSMKRYMMDSLRDSGIGLVTNYATTWRDICSMVIHMQKDAKGKFRLPWNVKDNLMNAVAEAGKVLRVRGSEMDDYERTAVETINAIGNINKDDKLTEWRTSVVKGAEAALKMLRKLQETAIDTAKTGIWVDFEKYEYLKLSVRATWHRKMNQPERNYESWSVMGFVDAYADSKWKELKEWALKTSKAISIGMGDADISKYRDIYTMVRKLKATYGREIHALDLEYRGKWMDVDVTEERNNKFRDINMRHYSALRMLALQVGCIDTMSILIYHASNDGNKSNGEGLSFVWQCWGEEFIHTLRHRNSGIGSTRLLTITMSKEFDTLVLKPGEYMVNESCLMHDECPGIILGYVKTPNGYYELVNYDNRPYLLIKVTKRNVETQTADLTGVKFRVIGFKRQVCDGVPLDRTKVREMLTSPMGNFMVAVKANESGKKNASGDDEIRAMVYIRTDPKKPWNCVGNIPLKGGKNDDSKFFTQALHNKILRVSLPKNVKDNDSNITLEIASVLMDCNKK